MDEEFKRSQAINKSQLFRQVKGFSSFLNNSTSYWKEAFNDLEKNICQCPESQTIESNNKDINRDNSENFKSNNNRNSNNNIDMLFTDKRNHAENRENAFPSKNQNNLKLDHETLQSNLNQSLNEIVKSSKSNLSNNFNNLSTNYNSNVNPYICLTETNINSKDLISSKAAYNYNKNNNNGCNNFNTSSLNKHILSTNSSNLSHEIKGLNMDELSLNANLSYLDPKKNWTKEEDEALLNFVNTTNSRNWKKIAAILKTKTPQQCSYRFNKIYTLKNQKKFTRNEDILIVELIEKHGFNWDQIVKSFPERKKEQIEDRYFNKLNPRMKRKEFEPEEDALLLKLHTVHGNNWSEIAKQFKDASVTMLKNRYYCYLKKKIDMSGNGGNNNYINNYYYTENNLNFNSHKNLNPYTNFTNSYSENSEFNSFEFSNSLGHNRNENRNSNFDDNGNESLNDEFYRNSSKSYDPVNYKTRTEYMNAVSLNNANEFNKIKEQEINKINKYRNSTFEFDSNSYLNLEQQILSPLDYEEFLKDFGKIEKLQNCDNRQSFNKENLNESNIIIDNFYNSNIDCNSTSLLDLLDDDIFSIDLLGKNTTRNSGESMFNGSNNAINDSKFFNSENFVLPNELNGKLIEFAYESSKNNSNNFSKGCNKVNNLNEQYLKNNYGILKEENKDLFKDEKMLIDDKEILLVPQNYTKLYNESPKDSDSNLKTKTNFTENYNVIFNEQTKRQSFSKTNSNEIREKIQLNPDNTNKHLEEIKTNESSANKINEHPTITKVIDPKEQKEINNQDKSDKYLIKQYKLLQEIYKKYKQYKNIKIKIKTDTCTNNVNENLNKILEADRNLNEKSESLLNELVNLRKDYKAYIKNVKRSKKLQSNEQRKEKFDRNFLRNSLLSQIDVMMKLISAIKVKIDLIKNFNNCS